MATVATLSTLDRPEKLNALDGDMIEALEAWVETVEADRTIRVVILTGVGQGVLRRRRHRGLGRARPPRFRAAWIREGHRVFDRLARLRQPVIVALNGLALGGGLELAVTGDLIIAAAGARLGLPETGLGMTAGLVGDAAPGPPLRQPLVKRMALTGGCFGRGGAGRSASSTRWRRRARPWRGRNPGRRDCGPRRRSRSRSSSS